MPSKPSKPIQIDLKPWIYPPDPWPEDYCYLCKSVEPRGVCLPEGHWDPDEEESDDGM